MSILGKIFTPPAPKGGARIKQAQRLIEQHKLEEARTLLEQVLAETEELSGDDQQQVRELRLRIFRELLKDSKAAENGNAAAPEALNYGAQLVEKDPKTLSEVATGLAEAQVIEPKALEIISEAVKQSQQNKKLLLSHAKHVLAKRGEELSEPETEFLVLAAENFPLWKDGMSLLADRFLREGRRDNDAVIIYRNAYPNRKADRRLREVLLESLIEQGEKDDFAAEVYRDAVEMGENVEALRLLAAYYIDKKELNSATAPYVERALEKTQFSEEALRGLAEQLLTLKTGIEPLPMAMAIYKQGFSDRNLLTFLSDKLAEAGKFDELAIEIMTSAFEQRVVGKRAVLILTEHCLANDRDDNFAISVYERYLGTWPDRPQRRIYALLSHHYALLTRVDEQAQKIYEEALADNPTDPPVVQILARAYHAADRRDDTAEMLYRQAFPQVNEETKKQLAQVLAEMRIAAQDYSQETLLYLTTAGRPSAGPLALKYDEALTNCFLAAGRRGEAAQEAYFALFERTENTDEINPALVRLLAEIIKESGRAPERGSTHLRVYRKLFDIDKFSTDPEVAYVLLADALEHNDKGNFVLQLAVLVFEADSDRFVDLVRRTKHEELVQEVGDFYVERHNFQLASRAFTIQAGFSADPSDEVKYRLAKIHLLEGEPDKALERISSLKGAEYARKRLYWEAAALQQKHDAARSASLLAKVRGAEDIPDFLIRLREALNLEVQGEMREALGIYESLASDPLYPRFERWIMLERGIVLMKLGRLDEAVAHLDDIYRHNPGGRAEQLFLSLALTLQAHALLASEKVQQSLPLFTRAVEVNRNHRLLRQVIVEILSYYGETAFFRGELDRSIDLLDVAQRILPKRIETKKYLAYAFHRKKDYAKALIHYRDIAWTDEEPQVERSQAYAFIENGQNDKAWRVFIDLARRGALLSDNFLRLVGCFPADPDARGSKAWEKIEFDGIGEGVPLAALLLHDGEYERASTELTRVAAAEPDNQQVYWYLGRAFSQLGKRDMAVHNWKKLLELCISGTSDGPLKIRQLTEIGLAFLEAGYAAEAMQTWAKLRELDDKNPDLPVLYAATLDLNAYQMARKDQLKLAQEEWKKALSYDPNSTQLQQNYSIACMLRDDFEEATGQFRKLGRMWQALIDKNPRQYAPLSKSLLHLQKMLTTMQAIKDRPEFDLGKIRAEDSIDYLQRANQFYWILGLHKGATKAQIEREYFRLIKIFNPERHAEDFMLVEESYTNLFKNPERREMLDLMVYNQVSMEVLRTRLTRVPQDGGLSFERLDLPQSVPPPDFSQLKPRKASDEELEAPLHELMAISFKIPDWTVI
jgi:tetratricopeptide (TPR) repeat protein